MVHKLLFLIAIFSLNLSVAFAEEKDNKKSSPEETVKMLDLFGDIFEKAREEYVEEVSDKKLIEGAINGMLTDLDPHSSYLNAKSFKDMQVQTRGEFGGLGIEVTMKNGLVYVVSPIDDTPAFKAGVKAGDYISRIDDTPVMGLTLTEAVARMRGKPGSKIILGIIREGAEEPLKIEVVRDIIKIRSVRSRKENDVAYVRVTTFSEQTDKGLKKALKVLKEEIGKDQFRGVVLDLRNNPGGLLDQAIAVSDLFLEQGEIVSTRGRDKKSSKRFNARPGDIINGLPVVVLINGGSASASEIVAGALQDHKRAVVMGEKSFGKGSVQTIIPVPGDGAMRLTTSRYYTPSGRSIQATGIEPDILVRPAKVEYLNKKNNLTQEADLVKHLKQEFKKKKEDGEEDKEDGSLDKDEKEVDYLLERALDLIRGLYIYKAQGR